MSKLSDAVKFLLQQHTTPHRTEATVAEAQGYAGSIDEEQQERLTTLETAQAAAEKE